MLVTEPGRRLAARLLGAPPSRARTQPIVTKDATATADLQVSRERAGLLGSRTGLALTRPPNAHDDSFHCPPAEFQVNREAETAPQLIRLRRGADPEPTKREILSPMASSATESGITTEAADASSDGLSAFIARILDQLTLSAWLPAGVFTAGAALLLQFRRQGTANVLHAVAVLTSDPVRVLVLIIPLLVIATIVTQAFSFEAIRTLEGYWRRRGLASLFRTIMIRRQSRRKATITERKKDVIKTAFYATRPRIIDAGISFSIVNSFEAQVLNKPLPQLTADDRDKLATMEWEDWCDAWRRAKIDQLEEDELAYPITSRVLPTRLGNLMRATEDGLENAGDDLQGFVLRRYALASRRVQMQHDQFRNRLEMYCILVFMSALLLVLTPTLLLDSAVGMLAILVICGSFGALSIASYLAAIASAGGYCAALKQMDETPQKLDETKSAG